MDRDWLERQKEVDRRSDERFQRAGKLFWPVVAILVSIPLAWPMFRDSFKPAANEATKIERHKGLGIFKPVRQCDIDKFKGNLDLYHRLQRDFNQLPSCDP
jgi:hypothetical protein